MKRNAALWEKWCRPCGIRPIFDGLWARVADETISTFGTDNVSMNLGVKQAENGMLGAMPGYPILQTPSFSHPDRRISQEGRFP